VAEFYPAAPPVDTAQALRSEVAAIDAILIDILNRKDFRPRDLHALRERLANIKTMAFLWDFRVRPEHSSRWRLFVAALRRLWQNEP
jgi:hypothetical protein